MGQPALEVADIFRVHGAAWRAAQRGHLSLGLTGLRGRPRGDLEALARAIERLSRLGDGSQPDVQEAEINPLLVLAEGQGVLAVDALVMCSGA